jgi:hypothetical protein
VEGDAIDKMRAAGYSDHTVRMGAIVSVRGFRAKPGAKVADRIPGARRGALERVMDLAKAGHIMYGTQITLPDGKKVPFGLAANGRYDSGADLTEVDVTAEFLNRRALTCVFVRRQ